MACQPGPSTTMRRIWSVLAAEVTVRSQRPALGWITHLIGRRLRFAAAASNLSFSVSLRISGSFRGDMRSALERILVWVILGGNWESTTRNCGKGGSSPARQTSAQCLSAENSLPAAFMQKFKKDQMTGRPPIPKWKQAVAFCCLLYAMLVWALPVFMLPFVNVLPYVHERNTLERLPFSVGGSIVVITLLLLMNKGKLPGTPTTGGLRVKVNHWVGVLAGLAMFTYTGAEFSPNLFGLATRLLPHESRTIQVPIESADYSGSRYKSVALQFHDPESNKSRHLVLSKRLFDLPRMQPGDRLELKEQKTILGTYIAGFSHRQRDPAEKSSHPVIER